jgi:hypothetical protein
VTIVGIRKVFGSVLCPDLGVFSSVEYIGQSIQAERLHLTRTASDGSTTLLFAAPCQYWTGLLPKRRVEGLIGTAGAGPGRPGMQPSIEILNAPSASAGFHREGDNSQRRFWPGQTPPVLASSLLRTLRKAILLFPGCWAWGYVN